MLRRCYSKNSLDASPTYNDCSVCDEWLNFQNFAKWHNENYYEVANESMHLDKDILKKGNKIYSPETCIFVPSNINKLIINRRRDRGELLLGVTFRKDRNRYYAQCSDYIISGHKGGRYIGIYKSEEEAFYAYKDFKEKLIKKVAEKYKSFVPEKLYNALLEYEININD